MSKAERADRARARTIRRRRIVRKCWLSGGSFVVAVVCFVLAMAFGLHAVKFFNEPEPANGSTLEFQIVSPTSKLSQVKKLIPHVPVSITEEVGTATLTIDLGFPYAYAGRQWALEIRDDQLGHAVVSVSPGMTSHTCAWTPAGQPDCEIFEGKINRSGVNMFKVPEQQSIFDDSFACHHNHFVHDFNVAQNYYRIVFDDFDPFQASGWAYETLGLPKPVFSTNTVGTGFSYHTRFGSYVNKQNLADAPTAICQEVTAPGDYALHYASPQPSSQDGNIVYWDESSNQVTGHVLTLEASGAAASANFDIVLAGMLIAMSAGFLPVVVMSLIDIADLRDEAD